MAAATDNSITDGRIHKAILRLALPTWASFFAHDLMGVVDMFFVGKLGASAVAAVGLSGAMIGIIIMLAQSVTVGTTALVAQAFGRGDSSRASQVAAQGVSMALGLSVLLAAGGIPLAPAIVRLMGAEGDVISGGTVYLRILCGTGFTMLLGIAFSAALRGAGDATTPFLGMIVGNIVNLVLDPILIFGWAGIPALGVAGSAWATMIGRGTAMLFMAHAFFVSSRGTIQLHVRDLAPHVSTMRTIAGIGLFSSGRVLVRNISMLLIMRLAAMFGTAALAAFGLCFRLQMMIFGPTMGFSVAASTVVGQNIGAHQPLRATRAGWIATTMAFCVVAVIATVFWAGAPWILPLFNDDPAVLSHGIVGLRWLSVSFAFMSMAMVLSFAMNGAGDTLRPMLVTGVALLVFGVPLAYGLALWWDSMLGLWVGVFASNACVGLLSAWIFHCGAWKEVGRRNAVREEALQDEAFPA
ncbi:MAG: MATE family efflux transporter [Verrucomicrobiota bacterium]